MNLRTIRQQRSLKRPSWLSFSSISTMEMSAVSKCSGPEDESAATTIDDEDDISCLSEEIIIESEIKPAKSVSFDLDSTEQHESNITPQQVDELWYSQHDLCCFRKATCHAVQEICQDKYTKSLLTRLYEVSCTIRSFEVKGTESPLSCYRASLAKLHRRHADLAGLEGYLMLSSATLQDNECRRHDTLQRGSKHCPSRAIPINLATQLIAMERSVALHASHS